MNLFEWSKRIELGARDVKALREVAGQAEAIRTRATHFGNALEKLRLSVGKARLLQERGVNVEFVVQSKGVRHFLAELRDKVAEDPAAILAAKDIQPKILKPIEKDTYVIQEAADRAWDEFVRRQMPRVSDELLGALSRVSGLRARVEHLRDLRSRALREAGRAPANEEEFELIRELASQCRQAWEGLDAEGMPMEVVHLFRDAATAHGAGLASLTPVVITWLTDHGLADALGIRLR